VQLACITIDATTTPQAIRDRLRELAEGSCTGILMWDERLGPQPRVLCEELLAGPGDVWHAGLVLGTGGQPAMVDFVAPSWMLVVDPPLDREATSWRVSFRACLVRPEVIRQLGTPCAEFDTLAGAALEWGHRAISHGALVRHVPRLVEHARHAPDALPLRDELRFVEYRYSHKWSTWAAMRALASGYATLGALARARRDVGQRPYPTPAPYRAHLRPVPDLTGLRVSVLIPTLSRYPYLRTVLGNLRAQTVRPVQIVVIDQTPVEDRDVRIADEFSDLPLCVLYRDRPGQCSARNMGLAEVTGDYVLFLDDDDEVPPTVIADHLRNLFAYGADVSSGVVQETGAPALDPRDAFVRASEVFPTGNSMVRRAVLARSGLFDLAFDRAPRADRELGVRLYLAGALMILDGGLAVIHHRAPQGGLRVHGARATTARTSREHLSERHLPHISEIYLASRHFSPRQRTEMLWLRASATLVGRGSQGRRLMKALVGGALIPDTLREIGRRQRTAAEWLKTFPQIPTLAPQEPDASSR
jgi:hypothetical protein